MKENKEKNENEILTNDEVTAHTAGLWKYLPVPDFPEKYPEFFYSGEKGAGFDIIGARVRGKKHKHEGTNCDDWFEYRVSGGNIIAVVADGAGSKPLSRIGAKESCIAAADFLAEKISGLDENSIGMLGKPLDSDEFISECAVFAALAQESVSVAFSAVEKAFSEREDSEELEEFLGRKPELRDFSSTFLAAAVIPVTVNGEKEHFVISVQIGDGMITSISEGYGFKDALRVYGVPDSGSFAGETEFMVTEAMRTKESLMSKTRIGRRKISSLLLMTDGVADDYYPNDPQLLRLYLDLKLNNIIGSMRGGKKELEAEPVAYRWVNDSDVSFPLQYARNIIDKTGVTLEKLWGDEEYAGAYSLESYGMLSSKDKAEMLYIWLENYVERGSFDDRTMVIVNFT